MKSPKESNLDRLVLQAAGEANRELADLLLSDPEIQTLQDYANTVSIRRLGYNDHGPVHMRQVALNALRMSSLLAQAGVELSLAHEEAGTRADSESAILLASLLHDVGMSVGRQNHELNSAILASPIIRRILDAVMPREPQRRTVIHSLALECIEGHMASQRIHSLEAGILLVADGCDMTKGRSRIPMMLGNEPRVGDIHRYSAASIERVEIGPGDRLPIKVSVEMTESVGFFQVEEVLLQKIAMSPAKPYLEVEARVQGQEARRYLG